MSIARFAVFTMGIMATTLASALEWETKEISIKTGFEDKKVTGEFRFINDTDRDVTITRVSASCGCTVPTLAKRTYAPGESGTIEAIFTIGSRQGVNGSGVTVMTDDPSQPTHSLKLVVDIPVALQMTPRVLNWRVGEANEPKTIDIVVHPGSGQTVAGLMNQVDGFEAQLLPGKDEFSYQLVITPQSTEARQRASFMLDVEPSGDRPLQAFAFIF